jgi:hypothetical protein
MTNWEQYQNCWSTAMQKFHLSRNIPRLEAPEARTAVRAISCPGFVINWSFDLAIDASRRGVLQLLSHGG